MVSFSMRVVGGVDMGGWYTELSRRGAEARGAQRKERGKKAGKNELFGKSVDDAGDAVAEVLGAEVDEQAEALVGEAEVGEKLLAMDGSKLLDGLEFDDDHVLDKEIGAEGDVEHHAIVDNGDRELTLDAQAAFAEFVFHETEIDGFEDPGAELDMELHRDVDDDAGDLVVGHGATHAEVGKVTTVKAC
jgi:hypothetical protein